MKKNSFIVRYRAFFLIAILFSVFIQSCTEKDGDVVKPETITDVIYKNEQFSILKEIIMSAKMGDALRTENLTLFAPNNAAFLKSGITASSVTSSKDAGLSFLQYHILPKPYKYSEFKSGTLTARNNDTLKIQKTADSTITVNDSEITTKDVNAANGIIQVIDRVLTDK